MQPIILDIATLAGVTLGLSQVTIKSFKLEQSRWSPLLDLGISVALSLIFIGLTRENALAGIIAGLTSAGVYNGSQTLSAKNPSNTPVS